jgi:hypothetical protein
MSETSGPDLAPKEAGGEDRKRRSGNILLLAAALAFIAAGVWLIDAMLAARKADECISAGRRCGPTNTIAPR